MFAQEDRARRIETLRELLKRLCASDLTLAESKSLRERMFALVEESDDDETSEPDDPHFLIDDEPTTFSNRPRFCLCVGR